PTQPVPSTLGAIAFYLVAFVVLTSYFRRTFGRHRWKQLHYTAYAAAAVFYLHGTLADPLLQNRPIDFADAEKAYVEGCALLVVPATIWRVKVRRQKAEGSNALLQTSDFKLSPLLTPIALIPIPTTKTTTAPIRLCHRKAIGSVHATVRTTAIPASMPQNAPAAVARFVRIASMNTPSSDP